MDFQWTDSDEPVEDEFDEEQLALPSGPTSTGKVSAGQQGGEVPAGWKPTVAKPIPVVRCTGTIRNGPKKGERCPKWSIRGGTVCLQHGAHLPSVKEAAQERVEAARLRLIGLTEDAIDALEEIVDGSAGPQLRLKAATEILDRAGLKGAPDLTVQVEAVVSPAEMIRERLAKLSKNLSPEPQPEDLGEIVEEGEQ